ncbi:MAG: polysaccharide biosynthesis/export family protein [Gammaproteobacteria bacterium]
MKIRDLLSWPMALMLGMTLAGCANELKIDRSVQPYPEAAPQLEALLTAPYLLQPGDKIDVKFYNAAELNESLTVRSDGGISLQLVGEMQASGKTPADLGAEIAKAYADTLQQPRVTVLLKESAAKVFVGGEIARPAFVKLDGSITAIQAVFAAGGFTEYAQPASVILIRKVNAEERIAVRLDLSKSIAAQSRDVALIADDVVFVPKSAIGKWDKVVRQYVQHAVPFPITYSKTPFFTTIGSFR